jgi:hypothetical protein
VAIFWATFEGRNLFLLLVATFWAFFDRNWAIFHFSVLATLAIMHGLTEDILKNIN